jgi:plastocyanin
MLRNTSLIVCLTLAALTAACSIAPAQSPPAAGSDAKITIKNFAFDPAEITVSPGTEVEWTDEGGKHTVEADNGSFKSGPLTAGATFKHRFARAGVYRYFCEFHGSKGGHDMAGTVTVK